MMYPWMEASLPLLEKDFEKLEQFIPFEETYDTFVGESLIGSEEWISFLLEKDPKNTPEPVPSELKQLLKYYVKTGNTVVEYGAGHGGATLLLSRLVGLDGKVLAFESNPENFRSLFWNLIRQKIQQAIIFCPHKKENQSLDGYEFCDLSLIKIDVGGREDLILKGGERTIRRCKPALLLNILGGISVTRGDRFVKEEFTRRMEQVRSFGYTVQKVKDSWYLALPNTNTH